MFKGILATILLGLAGLLGYTAFQPDAFLIERSILIKAPAEKIYAYLDDFHDEGWGAWSPWKDKDPNKRVSHSGAPRGLGAIYEWEGNDKVRSGHLEIVEATPPFKLVIKVSSLPSKDSPTGSIEFTLVPEGDMTKVTWTRIGTKDFKGKLKLVLTRWDLRLGKEFEVGLQNLKELTEK